MNVPATLDLANDNGTPEDHLAAATVAIYRAVMDLDTPVDLLVDALAVEPALCGTQP